MKYRLPIAPLLALLAMASSVHAQDAAVPSASAPASHVPIVSARDASDGADDSASDASIDVDADRRDATSTAQDAGADASADAKSEAGDIWASCMEFVPEGATRPKLTNSFPARGLAGYALPLQIQIEHGLGEKALPNGFRIQSDSDAARALAEAGFILPDPDGGAGPSLTRREADGKAITEILINFVALPDSPGRHELTLPPIPIAISRASGELLTLCTTPHQVTVDEPIANETEPAPQKNPPPRPQRETWTLARDLTYGILVGGAIAAVLTWLVLMWLRRPKPPTPPPPPRPPWEVAFESLNAIRMDNLIAQGKRSEHMDRVSDVVRVYLGARFGFDGIESTTDEVLQALRRMTPPLPVYDEVRTLLQESDLVKFARWAPTDTDCEEVVVTAESIVRTTMPVIAKREPKVEPAGPDQPERPEQEGPA